MNFPLLSKAISIHALREEGDEGEILYALAIAISIHALREEGDSFKSTKRTQTYEFLSTPSVRRATSVPASRKTAQRNFYPRPP